MTIEEELQLQDALNLNLQARVKELESIASGLAFANSSLRNDINMQALAMRSISRTVGLPVEGQSMATLAAWIKEHWKP